MGIKCRNLVKNRVINSYEKCVKIGLKMWKKKSIAYILSKVGGWGAGLTLPCTLIEALDMPIRGDKAIT